MRSVWLAREDDAAAAWRALSALVQEGVDPQLVHWQIGDAPQAELFDTAPVPAASPDAAAIEWPAGFAELAQRVALHDDPARFALLHRLGRKLFADARAWHDSLDDDRLQAQRMAQQVAREIHKMHAFVRFRPVCGDDGTQRHVAWFEPAHHIVRAATPFFVKRFAALHWAVATPRGCAEWDRSTLRFAPPAQARDVPRHDQGDALWLAYYRSIFNPARVKVAAMKREMPLRFWKHLPEAAAIAPLLADASARARRMVEHSEARSAPPRTAVQGAFSPRSDASLPLALRAAAARCEDCAFAAEATQTVWGEGAHAAALMLVGEQPGDREDLEGRPFVGPAGQLLRRAMAELGWPPDRVYLTNAVKHFKYEWRGKRRMHKTASQREALACERWLQAEIEAVQPAALIALGATAARSLLGRELRVLEDEGRWQPRDDGRRVLVVRHPAAILRAPPSQQAALYRQWCEQLALASAVLSDR